MHAPPKPRVYRGGPGPCMPVELELTHACVRCHAHAQSGQGASVLSSTVTLNGDGSVTFQASMFDQASADALATYIQANPSSVQATGSLPCDQSYTVAGSTSDPLTARTCSNTPALC
jgi:hypothetical protein